MGEDATTPRPPPPRASFSRTLMIMMVLFTIFVLFDPNLRAGVGVAAGALFYPSIGFGIAYPVLTILVAGSITTIISSLVRHLFTDWVKMTRYNKQLGSLRKAQMEALRKGNPGKVQKLRATQLGLQRDHMDIQLAPLKSLAFTFLLFITIFTWLSQFVYVDASGLGRIFFAVPWSNSVDLRSTYVLPAWILLYSLLAIPIGQLVSRTLKFLTFRKRLAALEAQGG